MIKKIIAITLLSILSFVSLASNYEAGKQYTIVNDKASAKPEVREYFSFFCPHCYHFEPFFAKMVAELPSNLPFYKNHVDFLRAASPEVQFSLSKALVVADQLKMEKKLVAAVFNYIHVQHATFSSEKDIRNVFVLQGVDGAKFDKLMKSFAVNAAAKKMKQNQDYFAKKGSLTGVPTVIVNNKYRINPAELDKKDPATDYKNLIIYLSKLH